MTAMEAIAQADRLRPNQYPPVDKMRWLERLEKRIWKEILRHYDADAPEPTGILETDADVELTADDPYDEMYIHWLCAQMSLYEEEYESFNAENAVFESVYGQFRNAYNREHMPLSARKRYWA